MKYKFERNCLTFQNQGFEPVFVKNSSFWRMFFDDGVYREITVNSNEQTPVDICTKGNQTIVRYENIKANNKIYDVNLTIYITATEREELLFEADIENNSEITVNELQLPYFRFESLGCEKEEEILYHTDSMGGRIKNIRNHIEKYDHSEYMGSDYHEIRHSMQYPSAMNMPWFGIQCDKHFLYVGRHEKFMRIAGFNVGCSPRKKDSWISVGVSQYPHVTPGEKLHYIGGVIKVFEGDWRDASGYYRLWSEENWFDVPEIPQWIKDMQGWQRIILKHQYGEIFYKYSDLPSVYKEGSKYGIDTLLVFGWWKGCFDNNYPEFEFDDELGGEEGLKKAINEVQNMGGRVILYTNGNLIDIKTDYYKNIGYRICAKDIDGNEYRDHYKFSNEGTLLKRHGYKSFVTACHSNDEWKANLIRVGNLKLSTGADSIFYDQLACHHNICFDDTHPHGKRIDEEAEYRKGNIDAIISVLPYGKALGTEHICDRYSALCHYTHGCGLGHEWKKGAFPDMFLHTFPEFKTSNRAIHDEKDGFKKHLNYAFVYNLMFDVALQRCRGGSMDEYKEYSNHIKMLIDLKNEYIEFFRDGKYQSAFDINRWDEVHIADYTYEDKKITVLCNNEDEEKEVDVYGRKIKLLSEEVKIITW